MGNLGVGKNEVVYGRAFMDSSIHEPQVTQATTKNNRNSARIKIAHPSFLFFTLSLLFALPGLLVQESLDYSVIGVLLQTYGVKAILGLGRDLD